MQTIKVQVKQVQGNGIAMLINGKVIASIYNVGRWVGVFAHGTKYGEIKEGMSYPEAVDFVTDLIERHFAELGLNVDFFN